MVPQVEMNGEVVNSICFLASGRAATTTFDCYGDYRCWSWERAIGVRYLSHSRAGGDLEVGGRDDPQNVGRGCARDDCVGGWVARGAESPATTGKGPTEGASRRGGGVASLW